MLASIKEVMPLGWRWMEWKSLSAVYHISIPQVYFFPHHQHHFHEVIAWMSQFVKWKYCANPSFLNSGTIHIIQKHRGISLFAARHGLNEVFLDLNGLQVMQGSSSYFCMWLRDPCLGKSTKPRCCLPQIKIPDWMRGYTCGMCGQGDEEYMQEYHTPNGRLASNELSFTQSWVIPGTGCRDISSNTFFF